MDIYVSKYRSEEGGVVKLRVDKDESFSKFTLCLWVYIFANTTEATVVNYGGRENLIIYFKNNSNFMIDMQEWTTYEKILLSFITVSLSLSLHTPTYPSSSYFITSLTSALHSFLSLLFLFFY